MALLIALAAVVDPSITSARRTRPLLSVLATDPSRDSLLVGEMTRTLERQFTVLHAPLPAAVGTVLLGDRLPDNASLLATPVIVVSSARTSPSVQMRRVQAPSQAMLDSRVTAMITVAAQGLATADSASSQAIGVELAQGGVVVARARIALSGDSVLAVPLSWVPSNAGPVVLQARAFVAEQPDTVRNDFVVDVRNSRWSVLFFDRRPSWMSTFVRRALERDPRFAVTSRVITSTNVSRETGRPPLGLDAIAATSTFDAVVIGAPDALTARDVDGVETLLRARGASVLMLADHAAAGPADALLDFGGWRTTARRAPSVLVAPTSSTEPLRLQGLAIGFPARLPEGATAIAIVNTAGRDSNQAPGASNTAIWRVPVGLGQLVVSGAFDAWRFRDTAQSTFDATFRDLIDAAARQRQRPLELNLSRSLVLPGADVSVQVTSRDTTSSAPIQLTLREADAAESPAARIPTTVVNSSATTRVRAPLVPGTYEVMVTQSADTTRAPLIVAPVVFRDAGNSPDLLATWADSRLGRVVPRGQIASLSEIVANVVRPVPLMTVWHPMRSAWWIVPFALALAAEWWIRRRQGLA
jgi:hypothetical protein